MWRDVKHQLVRALQFGDDGTPVGSRGFLVGSVGFSAMVAWNARELASVMAGNGSNGDGSNGQKSAVNDQESAAAALRVETARRLRAGADELAHSVADRWDRSMATWVDETVVHDAVSAQPGLGDPDPSARTLDAMLALLVDPRAEAVVELADGGGFDAPFGPCGAHRDEPGYDPDTYWRGPAWPQLGYLIWTALIRAGAATEAERVRSALRSGAARSELAEFWNPDTGAGRGARPQTWAGLGLVAERAASAPTVNATASVIG